MVYTKQGTCPCGKGKYSHVFGADGSGQEQEVVVMHCKTCKNAFTWKLTSKGVLPDQEDEYGWVRNG